MPPPPPPTVRLTKAKIPRPFSKRVLLFDATAAALSIATAICNVLIAVQLLTEGHAFGPAAAMSLAFSTMIFRARVWNTVWRNDSVVAYYVSGLDVWINVAVEVFAHFLPAVVFTVNVLHDNGLYFTQIPELQHVDGSQSEPPNKWTDVRGCCDLSQAASSQIHLSCPAQVREEVSDAVSQARVMFCLRRSIERQKTLAELELWVCRLAIAVQLGAIFGAPPGAPPTTLQIVSLIVLLSKNFTGTFLSDKASLETFDLRVLVFAALVPSVDLFSSLYFHSVVFASVRGWVSLGGFDISTATATDYATALWFLRLVCVGVTMSIQKRAPVNIVELLLRDAAKLSWVHERVMRIKTLSDHQTPALAVPLAFVRNATTKAETHARLMHVAHAFATARNAENISSITAPPQCGSTPVWAPSLVSDSNPEGSPRQAMLQLFGQKTQTCRLAPAAVYGVTQVLVLLFPLLNVAMTGVQHQSDFQLLCAAAYVSCLCVAALTLPAVVPYVKLLCVTDAFRTEWSNFPWVRIDSMIANSLRIVDAFVAPAPAAVVTATTPHAAVSRAVSELVVGPYLPAAQLVMGHLSSAECCALRGSLHLIDDVD